MESTRRQTEVQDVLATILDTKRREVEAIQSSASELRARALDAGPARPFAAALRKPETVQLLAEVKSRSPSAGPIRPGADPAEIARAYEQGGAAALSVLTDRDFFGGSLDALIRARAATALPVLRKDFIIDPVQIWEARASGADAVLLIVRALDDARLEELLALAGELGMDALIETHDATEVDRALRAGALLLGVNHRNLGTFEIDLGLSERLASMIPADVTLVAESGIGVAADVDRMGAAGMDAVLVGESLMRQRNVAAAAATLTGRPKRDRAR